MPQFLWKHGPVQKRANNYDGSHIELRRGAKWRRVSNRIMSRRNSNYDASQINATGLKSNYDGSLNNRRVSSPPIAARSRGDVKSTNCMSDLYSTSVVQVNVHYLNANTCYGPAS